MTTTYLVSFIDNKLSTSNPFICSQFCQKEIKDESNGWGWPQWTPKPIFKWAVLCIRMILLEKWECFWKKGYEDHVCGFQYGDFSPIRKIKWKGPSAIVIITSHLETSYSLHEITKDLSEGIIFCALENQSTIYQIWIILGQDSIHLLVWKRNRKIRAIYNNVKSEKSYGSSWEQFCDYLLLFANLVFPLTYPVRIITKWISQ